jgi:hypothetical protein
MTLGSLKAVVSCLLLFSQQPLAHLHAVQTLLVTSHSCNHKQKISRRKEEDEKKFKAQTQP